jgi:YVTN family beta-propeller protein
MHSKDSKRSHPFWARGIIVFAAVLGLGLSARPAAAQQPYVYVANYGSNNVSVIDTATNTPLTGLGYPITVGNGPQGIAVTPDGTHAIAANQLFNTVSVIDMTASPPSVATVTLGVGSGPSRVAITPNEQYAYVTNDSPHAVWVIPTATNTPLTGPGFPIPVGLHPGGVAITPDGRHCVHGIADFFVAKQSRYRLHNGVEICDEHARLLSDQKVHR